MTKKEIQRIMAIVRPAIIALYGRQSLKLIKYRDRLAYRGHRLKSLYLVVQGDRVFNVEVESDYVTFIEVAEQEDRK
jgi:hypothetical protein